MYEDNNNNEEESISSELSPDATEEITEDDRLASLTDDGPEEQFSDKDEANKEQFSEKTNKDSLTEKTKEAINKKTQEAKENLKALAEEDLDKVITLKINGEEKTMPVREAIKLTQLEQASRAKMQEAAQIKKDVEALAALKDQDKKAFLKFWGFDPRELAETILTEELELEEMSEEQRKLLEAEEKLKKYEEWEKTQKETEEKQKEEQEVTQAQQELDKEISEAWKESGLPLTRGFITAIAQEMYGASVRKEKLTASEAALRVKDNWHKSLKETISNLDAQAIHGLFGDEVLEKLRDFDVERVTQKQRASGKHFKSPGSKPASHQIKKSKSLTEQEYEQWKDSLISGL